MKYFVNFVCLFLFFLYTFNLYHYIFVQYYHSGMFIFIFILVYHLNFFKWKGLNKRQSEYCEIHLTFSAAKCFRYFDTKGWSLDYQHSNEIHFQKLRILISTHSLLNVYHLQNKYFHFYILRAASIILKLKTSWGGGGVVREN